MSVSLAAFAKRRLPWEEPLNALLGTMFGAGFATNNDLAAPARGFGGVFLEITLVIASILLLLSVTRLGALALSDRRWRSGVILIAAPATFIVWFAATRVEYATYGDVLLLAVICVWIAAYLVLGLSHGLTRLRRPLIASAIEPEPSGSERTDPTS